MASATVAHGRRQEDHHYHNHLHVESIPVVDFRLLSQPELLSLSLCFSSPSPFNTETELFTPKIDRSFFKESAGSRKQTFYRLRFAASRSHLPHQHSSPFSKPFSCRPLHLNPEPLDEESSDIISVLKSLFNIDDLLTANPNENEPYDDKDLVPAQIDYSKGNSVLHDIPVDIVSSSTGKRKRGRPRRDEKDKSLIESERLTETENAGTISSFSEGKRRGRPRRKETQSRVIGNEEKIVESEIEKVALGNVDAILGIEENLRRRTEGMGTEAELLEFMGSLEGEWASKSQKKRIIDADNFGNVLLKGWKLMLFVKRRAGHFGLACSRYISPNGQHFVSFKEVSSYLLSFGGLKDSSMETSSHTDSGIGLNVKPVSGNLPSTCVSSGHEKRAPLLRMGSPREIQRAETIKCHKCSMTFNQQDDFICHLVSSHQRPSKSSGHGTSTSEEVIMKNGKYECQFCHELFEERNCYSSHLAIHGIQSFNSPGNNEEMRPGFPCSEANGNSLVKTYICSLLSYGELDKVDRNQKTLADKDWDKQNKFCMKTDHKGEFVDAAATAADLNVCLGSEKVLSTPDKNRISRSSDKTVVRFAVNSLEEEKREMASNTSSLAPNAKRNMFSDENIEDRHFTSFTKGMKTDWRDKVTGNDKKAGCVNSHTGRGNVTINAEQENFTEGCSRSLSRNKKRGNLLNDVKGASVTMNSAQKRGSGCGLTSSKDDQLCVMNKNLIPVSTGALDDPESVVINQSRNNDSTIGFQSNLQIKKPSQDREHPSLTVHGREPIFPSDKYAFKVSNQTLQVTELYEAQKSSGLIQGMDSRNCGLDANTLASIKHDTTKSHPFVPSSYDKTFTCTLERKKDKESESSVHQQYVYLQNSNYETSRNKFSFVTMEEPKHKVESSMIGNAHARIGTFPLTGIRQESCSLLFSGNGKKFACKNNVRGISSGAVHEPKQNKGAVEDLFCQSGSEQTHVANNLNMAYSGAAHSGSRLQYFGSARNNEIMAGYNNHGRPTEDSMTGITWKSDEGNVLLSALADTSSQLLQSPGYYPTFDLMPHKVQAWHCILTSII
ncbi:hypothetical protein DITRI_Ditri03aG0164500 [Diplodiscus trichospermus]